MWWKDWLFRKLSCISRSQLFRIPHPGFFLPLRRFAASDYFLVIDATLLLFFIYYSFTYILLYLLTVDSKKSVNYTLWHLHKVAIWRTTLWCTVVTRNTAVWGKAFIQDSARRQCEKTVRDGYRQRLTSHFPLLNSIVLYPLGSRFWWDSTLKFYSALLPWFSHRLQILPFISHVRRHGQDKTVLSCLCRRCEIGMTEAQRCEQLVWGCRAAVSRPGV